MHVPDGFINAPVSAASAVVAAAAVAVSLRGARRELSGAGAPNDLGGDRTAPLAGLVAAFVFAAQMLNFPVATGTSGHLLGGALAAVLVGPATGVLCITVVLLLQGVLFADGGLTALGVNVTVMGAVGVGTAYVLFRGLLAVLPRRRGSVTVATCVAAFASVPASAAAFTLLYAVGGTTDVPIDAVLTAMVGVHALVGIGEAAITTLTVGAVLAVRPDLVYGARALVAPLKLRVGGELVDARPADRAAALGLGAHRSPRFPRAVWLTGLAVAVALAGFVSYYASAEPDGLEKVAADEGFDGKAEEHATADSPLADYGIESIADARLSGGLAGVIGVGATAAVGTGLFAVVVVRRRRGRGRGSTAEVRPATGPAARPPIAELGPGPGGGRAPGRPYPPPVDPGERA
ncbi:energy-coupling factor ABC transporter permease [Streptomyces sp. NPDC047315]|uniref:energy-coupling factor ABC transporter permease n=1 Tax=Streptomyces sp. NPDC047315 TaxID=3155142 RepID=UPI0033C5AAC7